MLTRKIKIFKALKFASKDTFHLIFEIKSNVQSVKVYFYGLYDNTKIMYSSLHYLSPIEYEKPIHHSSLIYRMVNI